MNYINLRGYWNRTGIKKKISVYKYFFFLIYFIYNQLGFKALSKFDKNGLHIHTHTHPYIHKYIVLTITHHLKGNSTIDDILF